MSFFPETAIKASTKATYMASSAFVAPAASTTDLFELFGSSTKTLKVLRIELAYYGASDNTAIDECFVVKRSTANTSGTSANLTIVPLDSTNAASTANSCKSYTANPTTGSLVGNISASAFTGAKSAAVNTALASSVPRIVLFDASLTGQPIVLRGTGQGVAVNFAGVKPSMGTPKLAVTFVWTEE